VRGAASSLRLLPCVCTLIVAAFQPPIARAAAIVDDVPVPGSTATLARALGIDPVPDRARFMYELTRLVYDSTEYRSPAVAAFLLSMRQPAKNAPPLLGGPNAADSVLVPLTADVWSDAVFHRKVTRESLVAAIVADRQASLLCHGLLELDDETLAFFGAHPSLLSRVYERSAPIFAAFAGAVRVHDNRVVPAGDAAVPLWELALNEKVTRADRFVTALLEMNDGRGAYLYDAIARMDAPHRAFAIGSWLPEPARTDRFRILATTGLNLLREWHVRVLPFGRSSYDFGMAVLRIAVEPDGRPAPPAGRAFWTRVFTGADANGADQPIDALWVAENISGTDVRQRSDRLDQLTFAQRVFKGDDPSSADDAFVLRAMPRFRALLLTLERAGLRNAGVYGALIRHAGRAAGYDGRRGYVVQAQLQGAIALVARMAAVRTLDTPAVERLLGRLSALPIESNGGYAGGVARWLREDVHPSMPHANDIEGALIGGLSGRPPGAGAPQVTWEGQPYRLDLTASEQQRLRRVREKQSAPPIDLPLQMAEAARMLRSDKLTADDLQDIVTQFTALATDLPEKTRDEEADDLPVGVGMPPPLHETIRKTNDELTRALRGRDLKRAARAAEPIIELADDLLARNLLSLTYAISIGDPDGTVLLADDVSHRHDFGFSLKDGELRARLIWGVPRQEVSPGIPWHVTGSLLGLDVGLATLSLRRVATDHMLEAPKLTSNSRDTFASSVSLLDPLALTDADRDAIAAGTSRGQARLARVDAAQLDAIAVELALEPWRLRSLRWMVAHGTADLAPMFSLSEWLVLGGGRLADLHAWGMGVVAVNGCLCSRLADPALWPSLAGRPQLGLAATVLPDVNFRIAMVLKELGLPSPLARVVLSAAMQDFIDEVRPTDDGDWLSLSRAARAITKERVEDYVAAATATGPLMPDVQRPGGHQEQ
jgi:hypothetical protein